ncbi:hypothetical protein D3OALGB2SA_2838 [Olavius algarvensis associated proteobacterium Delta 3]|nr:hypothetical protein D3OALGB2SA_2838 [Olavius algarvensis associated proteobacterium Delta 3]
MWLFISILLVLHGPIEVKSQEKSLTVAIKVLAPFSCLSSFAEMRSGVWKEGVTS